MKTGYTTVLITRPLTAGIPSKIPVGKVLAVSRGLTGRKQNQWGLPGGGIEPGESAFDGAVRELLEETGVLMLKGRAIYKAPARSGRACVTYLATKVRFPPGAPFSSSEGWSRWKTWKTLFAGPFGRHIQGVYDRLKLM